MWSLFWGVWYSYISFFKKDFIYLFLESGEGREKERERNISVWLLLTCFPLGSWPTTQECALTGNRTDDPLVCRPAPNPLSHTSQGSTHVFLIFWLLNCPKLIISKVGNVQFKGAEDSRMEARVCEKRQVKPEQKWWSGKIDIWDLVATIEANNSFGWSKQK